MMSRFVSRKSILFGMIALALIAAFASGAFLVRGSANKAHAAGKNPICSRIGNDIQVSSGAKMYCFGPQSTGPSTSGTIKTSSTFSKNVDAANPHEDITPNGTQAYGQSEVSIAGIGSFVVEAWNDATGFFAPCPSPMFKEELTGYGFSANGGKSFTDEGGLPNDCTTGFLLFGDPSVETWKVGGAGYFYISSLYINLTTGQSDLALNACKATGTGSSASISCRTPIIMAQGGPGDFLDKEFLSIDPARGRLYASYDRFGAVNTPTANGQVELAVCDIGTPSGGTGSAGGTAATPVCFPDSSPAPYFVVQPGQSCENEGAYPAVDVKSGDVYVAWEYNWASNFMLAACSTASTPVQNRIAFVPFTCLTLTPVSPCTTTPLTKAVNIVSLDLAFIPGYNRNPAGAAPAADFPRIAVSDKLGTVSFVWNDARFHPLGDILLQSFNTVSLSMIQSSPVRLNTLANGGLHFLPALRRSDDEGLLNVSFYQRNSPNTALTNVLDAINVNPRTTSTPSNTLVTTVASDWNNVSSDIIPNFGDYTDNYIMATASTPFVNDLVYIAWSDGRLGLPQPFEAPGPS